MTIRPRAARLALRAAARLSRARGLPLETVDRIRSWSSGDDPLVPRVAPHRSDAVSNTFLREALTDAELGTWSLPAAAINELESLVKQQRPRLVFEFGGGISTLCLARFMYELHGSDERTLVVSLDQSAAYARATRDLLDRTEPGCAVSIFVAPLTKRLVRGTLMSTYAIGPGELERLLAGRAPELVLVDGPAAESGARYATLPLIQSRLARDAMVILDDALRDGELAAARRWRDDHGLRINGVRLIGHGMLVGYVNPPGLPPGVVV